MFDSLMVYRNPEYDLQIACNIWNSGKLNPQGRAARMVKEYTEKVMVIYNN
jgi:hypothetical protein